ncbi:MAG: ABC transporter permease, partial [Porphyromonadaceae bacterium]|nr:ABC transporter permease [Porphyromonadaceae bacterium]
EVLMNHVRGYGASFCYTSLNNAREFTGMSPNLVSAIIIKADNHYEISDVCNRINRSFPGIRAWDRNELEKRTIKTILRESNMGVSFGSLVIFAVISGFFIIGLTLYTSTFDRVKDYGTLKAIGATNGYISRLVLLQAFLYAVVGYVIAVILLFMMKFGVAKSGLSLIIPPELLVELFLLTTFISVGGSFFAVAKLKKLEPASVFK